MIGDKEISSCQPDRPKTPRQNRKNGYHTSVRFSLRRVFLPDVAIARQPARIIKLSRVIPIEQKCDKVLVISGNVADMDINNAPSKVTEMNEPGKCEVAGKWRKSPS